ncbi:sulfotransferase domain-containing protein [Cylindrospermum stagnale]|uniref:sulfotransferase domain-containing protein n=1 Tax=Cylindrospermum stagnale TaxID=142864 RepID=UPI0002EF4DFE|nr:sulfotransferase domain-containing protein [Cylindrospermum stagnale]
MAISFTFFEVYQSVFTIKRVTVKDDFRDSSIWDCITHRPDDIVIASYSKSGTTLTQQIVNLLVNGHDNFEYLHDLSPWLEYTGAPLDEKIELIEKLQNRRFLKSHLPFDALPYYPEWRYICLVRDGRDVAVSLLNHLHAIIPEIYLTSPLKLYNISSNFAEFWEGWLETGKPYWDFFEFINSWWQVRNLPNVLLVHYADLIQNKPNWVEKIAKFLDIKVDAECQEMILHKSSLEYMRENSEKFEPRIFQKHQFIYKGTNGRWQNLLTQQQIKHYDDMIAKKLGTACANWVKHGGALPIACD